MPGLEDIIIPSWAGILVLLSTAMVLKKNVEFLAFLPSPVIEYPTIFSAIKNFTELAGQLLKDALPLFCDESVFRIEVGIFLQKQNQF